MRSSTQILANYKEAVKRRFFEAVGRKALVPPSLVIPLDPRAALELGMEMGRRSGYGDGLLEGTSLGLDVGLEVADEMLSQPVIFGPPGMA